MEQNYLGNPNLKKANVQQEWTKEELQEYKAKLTNISDEGWTHFEVQVDYDDDMSADYLRNTHGFEDEMENA